LEKRQEKRYQSADEVLSEIARIKKGIPVAERVVPKTDRSSSNELIQVFKRKWRLIGAVAVLAILTAIGTLYVTREQPTAPSARKKLVVLPFDNIGPPEDEYFADGITDEIIARIAGVSELGVIARNSAIQYKKTTKSVKEIGQELGVDYVLSGTIRWQKTPGSPGRVRITPTLAKVSDATHMWAEVYDESITGVFEVQSDISRKVVEALGVALRGTEQKGLEARPTQNTEAYDYYLRANEYYYRGRDTEKTLRLAIDNYEQAANLDPHFLQACAKLARAQALYYWYHFDHTPERIFKTKEAVDRAVQIDRDDPETQIALGVYFYHCQMDYDRALNHFALALKRWPADSFALEYVAYVKRRQGKMNETVENLKTAAEIDPQSNAIAFNLGETYALLRDYREAERWYTRALFLRDEYPRAFSWKTRSYLNQGDTNRARQTLEEASKSLGTVDPDLIGYLWVLTDIFENKLEDAQKRLAAFSSEVFSDGFYFVPKGQLSGQVYGLLKQSQAEKSHYESAVKLIEAKIKEDPQDSRYHSALGIALAGLGRRQEAIRAALKATEILPISKDAYRGAFRSTDLARVYTMVGEYDKAFDQIEYLLSIPGEISIALLRVEPTWAPLRSLPRFQKLPNFR
jgi:TolB-like protein/Flp pilus assembly protein TadD